MAQEIVRTINIDTKQSSKSIRQLKDELAGLTAELEDLEIGSQQYVDKLGEVVKVQDKLNIATESMQGKTVNAVKAFDSINQVAGGLAGGISAVSAAFTLFGAESEDLNKTMVKLQAAIAIVQGIGGLKGLGEGILNGVKSFRALTVSMSSATVATGGMSAALGALKTALITTGIGALVVGLGVLIDQIVKATSKLGGFENSLETLRRQADTALDRSKKYNEDIEGLEKEREVALAKGLKNELDVWIDYQNKLQERFEWYEATVQNFERSWKLSLAEILRSNKKFRKDYEKLFGQEFLDLTGNVRTIQNWKDYTDFVLSQLKRAGGSYEAYQKQIDKMPSKQKDSWDKAMSEWERVQTEYKNAQDKLVQVEEQIGMMRIKNERKVREEKAAELNKQLEERKKYNEDLLILVNQFYKDNEVILKTEEQRELQVLNDKYIAQRNAITEAFEKRLITEDTYRKMILKSNEAFTKEYVDIQQRGYKEDLDNQLSYLQELQSRESQLFANKQAALANRGAADSTGKFLGLPYETKRPGQKYKEDVDSANQFYELEKERIDRENELIDEQIVILREQLNLKFITEQEYYSQIEGLRIQQDANDVALTNAEKERNKSRAESYKAMVSSILNETQGYLNASSNLAGGFANIFKQMSADESKSEKEREKSFKAYKALAITQAVIQTVSSAQAAFTSALTGFPAPANFIIAPIMTAAAIASGIANVMAIKNESLPVGGTAETSTGSIATSAPAALSTAPFEYTRNVLGDKETDEINQPVKCYVVESDITNTQNRVKVTEENASF